MLLSDYRSDLRDLLHDPAGNTYTNDQLNGYINKARKRLVRDTGCLRVLQSFTLTAGTEAYSYSSFPQGAKTLDILNISVIWGNTRYPLNYYAWTDLNTQLRQWVSYLGMPVGFSVYGQNTVYVGPVPDQAYSVEIDTIVLPADLTVDTTTDQILEPYTDPVIFYAAHLAKYQEQAYGEAQTFEELYRSKARAVLASTFTRRLPSSFQADW